MVLRPYWEVNWFAVSQEIPRISRNRRIITALTIVRHLSLSWASRIQSIYPHPTSWRSILILSTHLRVGLPSGLFPSGSPTKTLYTPPLLTHTRYMPSPSHSSRFYHPHNIGWGFPHYCEHMEEIISISHECTYVELIATGWLKWLHTVEPLRVKQSRYRAGGAQSVPGSYDSQILWQRHRMVLGCQPYAPVAFTPRKYSWFSFLSTAESTLGPQCDRKDYVNEIFQWHHLESNQRPSYL